MSERAKLLCSSDNDYHYGENEVVEEEEENDNEEDRIGDSANAGGQRF